MQNYSITVNVILHILHESGSSWWLTIYLTFHFSISILQRLLQCAVKAALFGGWGWRRYLLKLQPIIPHRIIGGKKTAIHRKTSFGGGNYYPSDGQERKWRGKILKETLKPFVQTIWVGVVIMICTLWGTLKIIGELYSSPLR